MVSRKETIINGRLTLREDNFDIQHKHLNFVWLEFCKLLWSERSASANEKVPGIGVRARIFGGGAERGEC